MKRAAPSICTFLGNLLALGWLISGVWPLALASLLADCLDGWLARRWHTESEFGSNYDFTVDSTIGALIVFLVFRQPWLVALYLPIACYCRFKRWHFSGRAVLTMFAIGGSWFKFHGGFQSGSPSISIWQWPCSL